MFKRLFLVMLSTVTLLLPPVAFAETAEPSSEDIKKPLINDGALCDVATLGVSEDGASVVLRAVWEPKVYRCGAGYYLKKTTDSVDCAECPKDSYCLGFDSHVYNEDESDYGKNDCGSGYHTDDVKNTSQNACYKTETLTCAEKVNFSCPRVKQVLYNTETVTCTQHLGSESVCDSACNVVGLICEEGYEESHVDGVWSCVESRVTCNAGTYLPAGTKECAVCTENSFCVGGSYKPDDTKNQGIESCENNLKSPRGARSENDCGKILRVDGDALYLHPDKRGPNPSLVVEIDGKKWYANTTPVQQGIKPMSEGSGKTVHMLINGQEYTVHTELSGQ